MCIPVSVHICGIHAVLKRFFATPCRYDYVRRIRGNTSAFLRLCRPRAESQRVEHGRAQQCASKFSHRRLPSVAGFYLLLLHHAGLQNAYPALQPALSAIEVLPLGRSAPLEQRSWPAIISRPSFKRGNSATFDLDMFAVGGKTTSFARRAPARLAPLLARA